MESKGTQLLDFLGHRDPMKSASVMAQNFLHYGSSPEEVRSKVEAQFPDRSEEQLDEIISTQSDVLKEVKSRSFSSSPLKGGEQEEDFDFTPVSVDKLIEQAPKIEFLIEDMLPKGKLLLLTGPGGDGKSWFVLQMALCVDQGIQLFDRFHCRKGKVVFVDEEEGEETLGPRLAQLRKGNSDFIGTGVEFLIEKGLNVSNPRCVEIFEEMLERESPDLVIIDSLIRVHSAKESVADEMRVVTGVFRRWAKKYGCAICIIHHDRKPGHGGHDGRDAFRGSSEIPNNMDFHIFFQRLERDRDLFKVSFGKRRGRPTSDDSFHFEVIDPTPNSTVVRLADAPEAAQTRTEDAREFVIDLISDGQRHWRKEILERGSAGGYTRNTLDDVRLRLTAEGIVNELKEGNQTGIQLSSPSPVPIGEEDKPEAADTALLLAEEDKPGAADTALNLAELKA